MAAVEPVVCARAPLSAPPDRVGGELTLAALPHHRTCGSASGGSTNTLESLLHEQQRDQPHAHEGACRERLIHVGRSSVPPGTVAIASAQSGAFGVQAFSAAFLTEYWLYFELVSVLLVAAVVAAVAVVRIGGPRRG